MKTHTIVLAGLLLAAAGCKEAAAPIEPPKFRVTATINEDNTCTVSAMGKTYTSQGRIRGDKPAQFIGTMSDLKYHGFGCEVASSGTEGDIIVLFSGNNLGKPLEPGVYPLNLQILDETPPHIASVIFNSADYGPFKLRTRDGAPGTVTVEETPTGGRRIIVDVETVQWGEPF